jgi:hypothetical protein
MPYTNCRDYGHDDRSLICCMGDITPNYHPSPSPAYGRQPLYNFSFTNPIEWFDFEIPLTMVLYCGWREYSITAFRRSRI